MFLKIGGQTIEVTDREIELKDKGMRISAVEGMGKK